MDGTPIAGVCRVFRRLKPVSLNSMSLRLRLTLSFAALILLLAAAAALGLRDLTADLRDALDETATSVGRSVVTVMRAERAGQQEGGSHVVDGGDVEHRVEHWVQRLRVSDSSDQDVPKISQDQTRIVIDGRELSAAEIVDLPLPATKPVQVATDEVQFEVRHGDDGRRRRLFIHGMGLAEEIPLPQASVDTALEGFQRRLGWGLLALLSIGLAGAAWLAQRVSRPLRQLAAAARTLGEGKLGAQAPEDGPREVRDSIRAFNRMSADLARLNDEATTLRADRELAELGEIGRGLAHSLRNPLHALSLSLDALAQAAPDAAHGAALASASRDQLSRIDQALRGFLALSAGAGAAPESVRLHEVIDDVVLEASQRAQGRVRFERECAPELQVIAVPAELRIIVHTLVVNALEASPTDGLVRVKACAGDADDNVVIEVQDEGKGVSPAIRERLFQPHVSSKPTGAGMGLYLAQRLARQRYRGRLQLQDAAPQGTRAVLELHFGSPRTNHE